jgi:DNA-binding NarL/FixJ family response regulator
VISLVLADDHPVVREGVAAVLTRDGDIRILAEAASAEGAIAEVVRHKPNVLMIDVRLGGELDGIDACARLATECPSTSTVVLTRFAHESVMLRAFSAGAKGFLIKQSEPDILRQAVRMIAKGGTFVDPKIASKLVTMATKGRRAKGPHGLTLMEMRVLELLPKGLTNREIAEELDLSPETVKTHLRHAMQKLRVHDRAEAAAIAIREGLA